MCRFRVSEEGCRWRVVPAYEVRHAQPPHLSEAPGDFLVTEDPGFLLDPVGAETESCAYLLPGLPASRIPIANQDPRVDALIFQIGALSSPP